MSKGLRKFMYSQLGELEKLFTEKHEQYSSGADELANFRRGALLNGRSDDAEGMFEELKAYMAKHIAFVYTHDIHGEKNHRKSERYCRIQSDWLVYGGAGEGRGRRNI